MGGGEGEGEGGKKGEGQGGEEGDFGVVVGFVGGLICRYDNDQKVEIKSIVICRMVSINGILYSYCIKSWGI